MLRSIARNRTIYFVLGILFIFVLWMFGSIVISNDYIVPTIPSTFKALGSLFGQKRTYLVLGHTLGRLFLTVGICFVLAMILGNLAHAIKPINAFLKPSITILKTLPIAVIIILLLVMLKKEIAVYFIVSLVVFPLLYEAVIFGLESIDSNIVDEVKMQTSTTPYVIFKVYLPISFPSILTALIQSIGLGLKVLVMAEYIAQPKYSIGDEFVFYKDIAVQMEYVYAWSILLIVFILIVDGILALVKKKCLA